MEGEKAAVQLAALLLEHADGDLDARLAQLRYASALHLGEVVLTADDHPAYALPDYQVGAGRRLAVVGARLQRDVHRRLLQQWLVVVLHGGKGVHLGVALAAALVVAFADDPGVG